VVSFLFLPFRVQISAHTPSLMAEDFRGYPNTVHLEGWCSGDLFPRDVPCLNLGRVVLYPHYQFSKFCFVNTTSCYYFNIKFLLTVETLLLRFLVSRKQAELEATWWNLQIREVNFHFIVLLHSRIQHWP